MLQSQVISFTCLPIGQLIQLAAALENVDSLSLVEFIQISMYSYILNILLLDFLFNMRYSRSLGEQSSSAALKKRSHIMFRVHLLFYVGRVSQHKYCTRFNFLPFLFVSSRVLLILPQGSPSRTERPFTLKVN
jgi:hypothetical protein